MLLENHSLDLVNGRFSGTTADDLGNLFANLKKSNTPNHLVVHFHGGLVPRSSAQQAALGLISYYQRGKAYPVFFIWNSDLATTLTENLSDIAQEDVFKRLVRRLVQLCLGKLGESLVSRGGAVELESLKEIPSGLRELETYASNREPGSGKVEKPEITKEQRDQIEDELKSDQVLQAQSQAISKSLRDPGEVDREVVARSTTPHTVVASTHTRMSPKVLNEIAKESGDPGTRSAILLSTLAKYGVLIVIAVVRRYSQGRDHGLYTTIVEEVLRTLYVDSLGTTVWSMMKKDTADSFAGSAEADGGTAFLGHLAQWWKAGHRITLVGHSTGAIYIGNFLKHCDTILDPAARFDVIFLAPACTFDFMAERLTLFRKRVNNLRMFALQDTLERGYWEVPILYRGSLLYMISGLFEEPDVDAPILGMQRYHSAEGPYNTETIRNVVSYLKSKCVWSIAQGLPGISSGAKRHGDFDDDLVTCSSLEHILVEGL